MFRVAHARYRDRRSPSELPWRGLSLTMAFLLLVIGLRVYVSRFEQLFDHHTIFDGVTYTERISHLPVCMVGVRCAGLGAVIAAASGVLTPRARWLAVAIAPASQSVTPE